MMLGSAPAERGSVLFAELASRCEGPVGVLAAAFRRAAEAA